MHTSQEVQVVVLGRHGLYVEGVLGDLVSVLAWRRHLDGTAPVEVEVAQVVGQRLQLLLVHLRVVVGHKEVHWQHTSLRSLLADEEEVVGVVVVFSSALDDLGVDDGSRRRIGDVVLTSEESLVDSLVDDDESDFGRSSSAELLQDRLQSLQLTAHDLVPLRVTHSISVNDDVVGVVFVLDLVLSQGIGVAFLQLHLVFIRNLLSFFLVIHIGVVFGVVFVESGAEPDDTLVASVAHVHTHQHGAAVFKLRQLNMVEITSSLGIDLLEQLGSQRKSESLLVLTLEQVSLLHDLRYDTALVESSFDQGVVVLVWNDHNDRLNTRVVEIGEAVLDDFVEEPGVSAPWNFNPEGFSNPHSQLLGSLHEELLEQVRVVVVIHVVGKCPSVFLEINGFEESLSVAGFVGDGGELILELSGHDHWLDHGPRLHLKCLRTDLDAPLLQLRVVRHFLHNLANRIDLLGGIFSVAGEEIFFLSEGVGDGLDEADLGRELNRVLSVRPDLQQWLSWIQVDVVLLLEVVNDGNALSIGFEGLLARRQVHAHLGHLVGLPLAPAGHDQGSLEEIVHVLSRVPLVDHFVDFFKCSLALVKFVDRFYGKEDSFLVNLGACFEPGPELDSSNLVHIQNLLVSFFEESWLSADLDQVGALHHLLNQDVDEGDLDWVLVHSLVLQVFQVKGLHMIQYYLVLLRLFCSLNISS